jgi:UDP-galactopyranose mutase
MVASFLIVGAGLSGAVLADYLATKLDCHITIIDRRSHIGGNCYTYFDPSSGVNIHAYGAHIFNSPDQQVNDFWRSRICMNDYRHSVKANVNSSGIYQLPINLHTINQFFCKTFTPHEARAFLQQVQVPIMQPRNFEEQALSMMGRELYEAFIEGYTYKQWGVEPALLPASIIKRLPIRFNYDDNYYHSATVAMPASGYTPLFQSLLSHPNIECHLETEFNASLVTDFDHVFYSGCIDEFFGYCEGRLGYRTVYWENHIGNGDYQGCSVMNYPSRSHPYTRIIEHKHFTPWQAHDLTYVSYEYSKETQLDDIPYYPKRLDHDLQLLSHYQSLANSQAKVTFLGRLGTYRYLDMWKVTREALDLAALFVNTFSTGSAAPVFPCTD